MESYKEKAKDLVRTNLIIISNLEIIYGNNIDFEELKKDKNFNKAIECAKIAVDEVIEALRIANSMYELHELLNEYKGIKNELNNM